MKGRFFISVFELSRIYRDQEVFSRTSEGALKFVKEIEGEIRGPYGGQYHRESEVFVQDEEGNVYSGIVTESGDSKKDMQIDCDTVFEKVPSQA